MRERRQFSAADNHPAWWRPIPRTSSADPRPFSVAAEELTVSLKLRRNVVLAKYAEPLADLYRK